MPKLAATKAFPNCPTTLLRAVVLLSCLALPNAALTQTGNAQGLTCLQLVEALATDGRVPLQGVTFDFNRATLRPDSLPALIAARDAILTIGGAWEIEGHTDTVGSRDYNQTLSETRAQSVRDWLISAGVPAAQLTAQGFSFDRPIADNSTDAGRAQNRRVELVGAVMPDSLGFGGPAGVDPCPDTLTPGTRATSEGAPPPPAIPDWSGAAGQEWLPFSGLMATGYGGASGWRGDRVEMPPGARPEACQALCTANSDCAAFSFEPAGSHFVETARCALMGYGTELNLTRDNSYYDGGTFFTSGLKTDARLLTPQSDGVAQEIIADMAEIARLRETARITAPDTHVPESWMDVAIQGAVPGDVYATFLEITLPGNYAFDWMLSKTSLFVSDMADRRSGQIWVPEPGDYILRYVIDHPTAGRHTIVEQSLLVQANAIAAASTMDTKPARGGTVEPGIDRPGMDIAQTPITVADPLICQALCADDANCASWTYVNPGLQGGQAICWTKSGVPDGLSNPCCTSGVMDQAAAATPAALETASLSFPNVVSPDETLTVSYTGPLNSGDWVDIITTGNDADMSGGWSWAYATGTPVTLTAPGVEGDYTLRYVAEDTGRGRIVLAQDTLSVRASAPVQAPTIAPVSDAQVFHRCDGTTGPYCELALPAQDVILTLAAGYGITEPLVYETAGGARADRASFDVLRLSDGQAVIIVNARQAAQTVYCQTGLAGDEICLTQAFTDNDAALAGATFASLTSAAMMAELDMMGSEDAELIAPGDLQGIWVFRIDAPGTSDDGTPFIVAELMQDAGDIALEGNFTTAPDSGPLTNLSGDLAGVIAGDTLNLTLVGPDGVKGLVFSGTEYGSNAFRGMVYLAHSPLNPAQGAIMTRIAGSGEAWDGPPWMTGAPDGMAAALQIGAQALEGIMGGQGGEDRVMSEMLGAMMGAMSGGSGQAPTPASPMSAALEGTIVEGLSAADALILIAPHLED